MNQAPRKKRRILKGGLVLLAAITLMAAIAWILLGALSERSNDALRAKGYPTTLSELQEWYPTPPPGENAADYYLEAGKQIEAALNAYHENLPIQADIEYPPLGTPLTQPMRVATALFLHNQSAAYDLIDAGTQFDAARYPVQFNAPLLANPFPHLGTIRHTVRAQMLRTLYFSGQEPPDALVDEFDKLVAVASSLRDEPILISHMVAIATTRLAVDTAERILNENEFTPDQLQRIDSALARLENEDGLVRAFVGERTYSASLMAQQFGVPIIGSFIRADYLGGMDEFIEIAEEGLPDRLDEYRSKFSAGGRSYARPLSSMMTPNLTRAMLSHYEAQARLQAARAAVAVQIQRSKSEQLPDDRSAFPTELQNDWPTDPFTGDPLLYKRLDQGFVVYSVGGNFEDDGGVPANADQNAQDVTFQIQ